MPLICSESIAARSCSPFFSSVASFWRVWYSLTIFSVLCAMPEPIPAAEPPPNTLRIALSMNSVVSSVHLVSSVSCAITLSISSCAVLAMPSVKPPIAVVVPMSLSRADMPLTASSPSPADLASFGKTAIKGNVFAAAPTTPDKVAAPVLTSEPPSSSVFSMLPTDWIKPETAGPDISPFLPASIITFLPAARSATPATRPVPPVPTVAIASNKRPGAISPVVSTK